MGEKETSGRVYAAAQPGDEEPDAAGTIVKSKSNITNNREGDAEARLGAGAAGSEPAAAVNLNSSKSNRLAMPGTEPDEVSNLNLSKSN